MPTEGTTYSNKNTCGFLSIQRKIFPDMSKKLLVSQLCEVADSAVQFIILT